MAGDFTNYTQYQYPVGFAQQPQPQQPTSYYTTTSYGYNYGTAPQQATTLDAKGYNALFDSGNSVDESIRLVQRRTHKEKSSKDYNRKHSAQIMPTEYTTLGEPTGSLNYGQETIVEPMVTVGPRTDVDLSAYYGQTDMSNLGASTTNYTNMPQTSTAQYATAGQPNYQTNYTTVASGDPTAQYATAGTTGASYYYPTTNYQTPVYESYPLPYDPCAQYYNTQQTSAYVDQNAYLPMGSRVVAEYILGYGNGATDLGYGNGNDVINQQITQQTTQQTTQILEKDISAKDQKIIIELWKKDKRAKESRRNRHHSMDSDMTHESITIKAVKGGEDKKEGAKKKSSSKKEAATSGGGSKDASGSGGASKGSRGGSTAAGERTSRTQSSKESSKFDMKELRNEIKNTIASEMEKLRLSGGVSIGGGGGGNNSSIQPIFLMPKQQEAPAPKPIYVPRNVYVPVIRPVFVPREKIIVRPQIVHVARPVLVDRPVPVQQKPIVIERDRPVPIRVETIERVEDVLEQKLNTQNVTITTAQPQSYTNTSVNYVYEDYDKILQKADELDMSFSQAINQQQQSAEYTSIDYQKLIEQNTKEYEYTSETTYAQSNAQNMQYEFAASEDYQKILEQANEQDMQYNIEGAQNVTYEYVSQDEYQRLVDKANQDDFKYQASAVSTGGQSGVTYEFAPYDYNKLLDKAHDSDARYKATSSQLMNTEAVANSSATYRVESGYNAQSSESNITFDEALKKREISSLLEEVERKKREIANSSSLPYTLEVLDPAVSDKFQRVDQNSLKNIYGYDAFQILSSQQAGTATSTGVSSASFSNIASSNMQQVAQSLGTPYVVELNKSNESLNN